MCDSHLHLATKNHLKKMLNQNYHQKNAQKKNHNTQLIFKCYFMFLQSRILRNQTFWTKNMYMCSMKHKTHD